MASQIQIPNDVSSITESMASAELGEPQNSALDAVVQAVLEKVKTHARTSGLADTAASRALTLKQQKAPSAVQVVSVQLSSTEEIFDVQNVPESKGSLGETVLTGPFHQRDDIPPTPLIGVQGKNSDTVALNLKNKRAEELVSRPYLYERVAYDQRMMVFSVDGSIGLGRGGREQSWQLMEEDNQLCLEIFSDSELTCRLHEDDAGGWQGRWLCAEEMPIHLAPLLAPSRSDADYLEVFIPAAGRQPFLMHALRQLRLSVTEVPVIVEISSFSQTELILRDESGWSTLAFAWYAAAYGAEFYTVDASRRDMRFREAVLGPYLQHANLRLCDGSEFLGSFTAQIDLLCIGTWAEDPDVRQSQYLEVYQAMSKRPSLLLLSTTGMEHSAELWGRALLQRTLRDGYDIVYQSKHHLLLGLQQSVETPPGMKLSHSQSSVEPDFPQGSPGSQSSSLIVRPPQYSGRMFTSSFPMRVFTHDRGDFRSLRGANVLIYWPHGFGDCVFFSYILPLLSTENRYWISHFGDDSVALYEGCSYASPLYIGSNSPMNSDGAAFASAHFGLRYESINGGVQLLSMPHSLAVNCARLKIDTLLWSDHPETYGAVGFPYHSKARLLIPHLGDERQLSQVALDQPLASALDFSIPPWLAKWVEARLQSFAGLGERRLCVISRNGYTSTGKNWGHQWREDLPGSTGKEGQECREFMRLLLQKDPNWVFLIMEDHLFEGDQTVCSHDLRAYSYAQLFGSVGGAAPPFGLVLRAILDLAALVVGVPTGPFHLAMAKPGLPTVGLWIEHMPCWYDEPKEISRHLVSRNVVDRGFLKRPGSFESIKGLHYKIRWLDSRIIPAEAVMQAVEELIYTV